MSPVDEHIKWVDFFYVGFFSRYDSYYKYIAAAINKLQFKDGKLKPLMETSHFLLAPQKVFMSRHFKKCVRPLILRTVRQRARNSKTVQIYYFYF